MIEVKNIIDLINEEGKIIDEMIVCNYGTVNRKITISINDRLYIVKVNDLLSAVANAINTGE